MGLCERLKVCSGRNHPVPFRFELDGATWIGATDGPCLAAEQTTDEVELNAANGRPLPIQSLLRPIEGTPVSLATLRAWCGEQEKREPCRDCKGTRRLECKECNGTGRLEHDCDCDHCTIDDDGPCDECDSKGMYACEECTDGTVVVRNPGVVGGAVFDRNILRRVCLAAPDIDTVMVAVCGEELHLIAPWWRGAMMRLRQEPSGLDVFPEVP